MSIAESSPVTRVPVNSITCCKTQAAESQNQIIITSCSALHIHLVSAFKNWTCSHMHQFVIFLAPTTTAGPKSRGNIASTIRPAAHGHQPSELTAFGFVISLLTKELCNNSCRPFQRDRLPRSSCCCHDHP